MGRHVQFVMTPPRGDPLKSNSISMYFPFRDQRERETLLPPLLTTLSRRGLWGPHSSLSSPHTLSSQLREMFTYKSRGVVVANGLGIAKSCRDKKGAVRWLRGEEGFQRRERSKVFQ